jgi:hypothetical protein
MGVPMTEMSQTADGFWVVEATVTASHRKYRIVGKDQEMMRQALERLKQTDLDAIANEAITEAVNGCKTHAIEMTI